MPCASADASNPARAAAPSAPSATPSANATGEVGRRLLEEGAELLRGRELDGTVGPAARAPRRDRGRARRSGDLDAVREQLERGEPADVVAPVQRLLGDDVDLGERDAVAQLAAAPSNSGAIALQWLPRRRVTNSSSWLAIVAFQFAFVATTSARAAARSVAMAISTPSGSVRNGLGHSGADEQKLARNCLTGS